jgi:putative oxidoreductase
MLNIIIWVVQGLLAPAFLLAGVKLARDMAWANDFPAPIVNLIGIAEVLGAIGLILPELTGILPWLTIVAAAGLAIIMAGAVITLIVRKEYSVMVPSVVFLILTVLVLVGRLTFAHI